MSENTQTYCEKCCEVSLISRRIHSDGTPSYIELQNCITAIKNITGNILVAPSPISRYYSFENTVLAGIEISYFKSKTQDFISAGTLAYSHDTHTRRTLEIDPTIAWDFLSANLAMISLALTQSLEIKIQNLRNVYLSSVICQCGPFNI